MPAKNKSKKFYQLYVACMVVLVSVFAISLFAADTNQTLNTSSFADTKQITTFTNPVYKNTQITAKPEETVVVGAKSLSPFSLLAWSSFGIAILMVAGAVTFYVLRKRDLIEVNN